MINNLKNKNYKGLYLKYKKKYINAKKNLIGGNIYGEIFSINGYLQWRG